LTIGRIVGFIYYNPSTGRFLTADPIGLAAGDTNFYRYVGNNPINFNDPMGLKVDGPIFTPNDFNAALNTPAGQSAAKSGFIKSDIRFVYTDSGVIDMRHAQAAFNSTNSLMSSGVPAGLAGATTYAAGVGVELLQGVGLGSKSYGQAGSSSFSSEDIPSNSFGIEGAKNNSSFNNFVGNIKQPNACNGY
jgi:uncharacterized protein RhaS with RHS repeats